MAKNQPGPRVTITRLATPESAPPPAPDTVDAVLEKPLFPAGGRPPDMAQPTPATPLAVVPSPPRVARVELLADRIVLTNPTIKLDLYVFLPGTQIQTDLLKPATATIMHGEIVIEELGLIWPVARAHIRTR